MTYDLHIHSCLSPCAEDDMTPANIAGFAKLNSIDLIAVTDHNGAANLPSAKRACDAYGVKLLPGVEMTTEEEIHLLGYFADVDTAVAFADMLYERLPPLPYDKAIWGRQLVMDENDNIIKEMGKLLTGATSLNLYAAKAAIEEFGGIAIPAHVDKDTTSLLSVLGFAPEDLPFAAYEVKRPEHSLQKLWGTGRLPMDIQTLTSSDAHQLADIAEFPRVLAEDSVLWRLLK